MLVTDFLSMYLEKKTNINKCVFLFWIFCFLFLLLIFQNNHNTQSFLYSINFLMFFFFHKILLGKTFIKTCSLCSSFCIVKVMFVFVDFLFPTVRIRSIPNRWNKCSKESAWAFPSLSVKVFGGAFHFVCFRFNYWFDYFSLFCFVFCFILICYKLFNTNAKLANSTFEKKHCLINYIRTKKKCTFLSEIQRMYGDYITVQNVRRRRTVRWYRVNKKGVFTLISIQFILHYLSSKDSLYSRMNEKSYVKKRVFKKQGRAA